MSSPAHLSADALRVYALLTQRLDLLADQVPAESGLPSSRSSDAIAELVRSELARVVRLDGGALRVEIGPVAAVQAMLDRPDPALSPSAARLLRARLTLREVLDRDPATGRTERVTDRVEIARRLSEIGERTRRELFSLHAGDPPPAETLDEHLATDLELVRRGIGVYMVYPVSFLQLEHLCRYADQLQRAGAHVGFADDMPHRLVVSDRMRAVVPIEMSDARRGALFTSEAAVCRSLHHLALSIFRRSRPRDRIDPADPGGPPSPLERRVLILMSSGVTDVVAAKQLGVTDRTFRRYVADLLHRLGASSRFQAGVKAVERGWI